MEVLIDLDFKIKHDAQDVAKIIDDIEVEINRLKLPNSTDKQSHPIFEKSLLDDVKMGDTVNVKSFLMDLYHRLERDVDTDTIINFESLVNQSNAKIDEVFKTMLHVFKENRYPVSDYEHIAIDEAMIRLVYGAVAA